MLGSELRHWSLCILETQWKDRTKAVKMCLHFSQVDKIWSIYVRISKEQMKHFESKVLPHVATPIDHCAHTALTTNPVLGTQNGQVGWSRHHAVLGVELHDTLGIISFQLFGGHDRCRCGWVCLGSGETAWKESRHRNASTYLNNHWNKLKKLGDL